MDSMLDMIGSKTAALKLTMRLLLRSLRVSQQR